jgi:endonuclease/exonuclease/phosphatase (EEP) superfamily protein YafD
VRSAEAIDYLKSTRKIIPSIEPDLHTPMIITGDFNVDVSRNQSLQDFMQRECNLTYVQTTATTLGNICIDLTLARNLNVSRLPFVSHYPQTYDK